MVTFLNSYSFNPRSRTGSDPQCRHLCIRLRVSIHAPERGATLEELHQMADKIVSIHAPERGATRVCNRQTPFQDVSIHAPERGATYGADLADEDSRFQSTLPNGERQHNENYI